MKRIVLFTLVVILAINVSAQPAKNLTLVGSLTFPGQRLSGCWHYTHSSGSEYAIVGAEAGIVIVNISNPSAPTVLTQLPGVTSLWHEVKVIGNFAYAVSEGVDSNGINNGVQIIDLRYLPDSVPYSFYLGDGFIAGQIQHAHSITAAGNYIYVNGHNLTGLGRGVLIVDVSNPFNPVFTGAITQNYCHDSYVRDNRIYTSDILAGQFSVYDISNPQTPVLLATQGTPGQFNHNTWLNDAGNVLFAADERNNVPLAAFDISDLSNITLIDTFFNGYFTANEVHNVRVLNDFVINPSYGSQLTIADAHRPGNLIEVANYTTGNSLCWDADPYLTSGHLIATDMNSGMFYIFNPTYVRACYLEGNVTDSLTGFPLNNVNVEILNPAIIRMTDQLGNYTTGYVDSGTYQVRYSLPGYNDEIRTVQLNNGVLTILNVKMKIFGTGINSLVEKNLRVFPNPANEKVQVKLSNSINGFELIDQTGKIVKQELKPIALCVSGQVLTIDTKELATGVYILKIYSGNESVSSKLSIQH